MPAHAPTARRALPAPVVAVLACAMVAVAAVGGGVHPAITLGIVSAAALLLLLGASVPLVVAFYLSPLLVFLHRASAWRWFDLAFVAIVIVAAFRLARTKDRRAWEIHAPGWIVLAFLTVPWFAFPFVPEPVRWFAEYKVIVMMTLLFLALRRLVPRERSDFLLAVFPVAGFVIWSQLGARLEGAGGLATTRVTFRNFYTNVGWGQANYVAGVLVLTLGASTILFLRARRWWLRVPIGLSILAQLHTFVPMQSRGGTVALGAMLLVLAIFGGWRTQVVAAGLGVAGVAGLLAEAGGRALLGRFSDPVEAGSWLHRMQLWTVAWERFLAHPWTGIGIGQWAYQADLGGIDKAHNYLLQAMQDGGVPGLLQWIAWTVGIVELARRAHPSDVRGEARAYRGAVMGAVVALLVHALVEPTFGGYEMQMLCAWFLAWLALQDPRAGTRAPADETVVAGTPSLR